MREILERVVKGEISIDEAERMIRLLAIEEIEGLARIDVGREFRKSVPEIILAEGKRPEELAKIALKMMEMNGRAIISRVSEEQMHAVKRAAPEDSVIEINEVARTVILRKKGFQVRETGGKIGIITAGTSDIPVAEEARVIAEEMGCKVLKAYDVGVAGIHRLIPPLKAMMSEDVDVIIVVAGREGALPSVVAGIVDRPVIAVPASTGYGFGERGVGALMAMLQSCSLGLAVVNIDGGVAAGAIATMIANRAAKFRVKNQ